MLTSLYCSPPDKPALLVMLPLIHPKLRSYWWSTLNRFESGHQPDRSPASPPSISPLARRFATGLLLGTHFTAVAIYLAGLSEAGLNGRWPAIQA